MNDHPSYVVFIDFDGVTHAIRGHTPRPLNDPLMKRAWLCSYNVGQINRLLRELDAVGVITSAWRFDHPWEAFQAYFDNRLVGQSPLLGGIQKHADFRQFLADHSWNNVPWVAIDDKPTLFAPGDPVIAMNYRIGLTDRDVSHYLQSIAWSERFGVDESLQEYYCAACHRCFVAVYAPFRDTPCPACGTSDERRSGRSIPSDSCISRPRKPARPKCSESGQAGASTMAWRF